MARTNKSTEFPSAAFDQFWPPNWQFPPTAPWVGAVASRSEVRADLVQLFARHSRSELLGMLGTDDDSQDPARPPTDHHGSGTTPANPIASKWALRFLIAFVLYAMSRWQALDDAKEKWPEEEEDDNDGENGENGENDQNGGTDTGGDVHGGSGNCDDPGVLC